MKVRRERTSLMLRDSKKQVAAEDDDAKDDEEDENDEDDDNDDSKNDESDEEDDEKDEEDLLCVYNGQCEGCREAV